MSDRDYYEVLGLARGAEPAAIKQAYRKLAMQHHPDQNPGDHAAEERFKEINEAYAILSDADKRAQYDRFGKAAFQNGGGAGRGYQGDPFDLFNEVFGDMFGDMMGGRARRGGPIQGADLRYDLEISLEEAFSGKRAQIDIASNAACEPCSGSGAAPGSHPETCSACGGAGRVRVAQGFFAIERACPNCGGRGQIVRNPCKSCSGRGVTRKTRTLSFDIPPGVEDGTRIRLGGEGDSGPMGGPNGDLHVFLSVRSHELFERDGGNLYCRAPVPMATAALGGEIEIPTIEGSRARVTVPEGAQTGRRFRLKGKGMTRLRARDRGDMFVEIVVETPVNLTARQRELLQEFASCCDKNAHPESQGFFDKVKRFFDGRGADQAGR